MIWLTFRDSARLKNIEETEKAKRQVAEVRKERKRPNDEEHLVATRCPLFLVLSFEPTIDRLLCSLSSTPQAEVRCRNHARCETRSNGSRTSRR